MRKPSNMGGSLRHSLKWDMMPLGFEPHSVRLPRRCSGKESTCQGRIHKRYGFNHWVGKIPWRKKWQPTPVFLLGKFCGQRSLVGYSPGCHKELDMTEDTYTRKHSLTTEPVPQAGCCTFPTSCMCARSQLCPALCNPMDCSLPGSSVHSIFQARMLECITVSFSGGSFQPRDQTHIFCIACIGRWNLSHGATWEARHSTG